MRPRRLQAEILQDRRCGNLSVSDSVGNPQIAWRESRNKWRGPARSAKLTHLAINDGFREPSGLARARDRRIGVGCEIGRDDRVDAAVQTEACHDQRVRRLLVLLGQRVSRRLCGVARVLSLLRFGPK